MAGVLKAVTAVWRNWQRNCVLYEGWSPAFENRSWFCSLSSAHIYQQRNYCRKGPSLCTSPAGDSQRLRDSHWKSSGRWHCARAPGMLPLLARAGQAQAGIHLHVTFRPERGNARGVTWPRVLPWPLSLSAGRVPINRAENQMIPGVMWVLTPEITAGRCFEGSGNQLYGMCAFARELGFQTLQSWNWKMRQRENIWWREFGFDVQTN